MTFGSKPLGVIPQRPRSSGRGESAFAVGSRVEVTGTGNAREVELLDEIGLPTPLRMGVAIRVIITAWRPRRSAPPRYRVRSDAGIEGWIDAAHLRRIPPPPPPVMMKPLVPLVPVAAPKGAARPKKVAVKAVAPKAVAPKSVPPAQAAPAVKIAKGLVPMTTGKGPAAGKASVGAKIPARRPKGAVAPKSGTRADATGRAGKSPASPVRPRQASTGAAKAKTKAKAKAKANSKRSGSAPKRKRKR